MVHKNLQVIAFLCLIVSFSFLLSTMIYDTGKQWRVMAMGGEAVEAVVKYDGLFLRCTMYPTGQEECEGLDGNNLPEHTTVCTAFMFVSLALCVSAIFLYFVGSAHTVCLYRARDAVTKKAKMVIYSAVLSIIYSLFILITGILYTLGVNASSTTDFVMQNAQVLGGNTGSYSPGSCIQSLWIGMAFGLAYGILAIMSSKGTAYSRSADIKDGNFWGLAGGEEYAAAPRNDYDYDERKPYNNERERIPMNETVNNNNSRDIDYI